MIRRGEAMMIGAPDLLGWRPRIVREPDPRQGELLLPEPTRRENESDLGTTCGGQPRGAAIPPRVATTVRRRYMLRMAKTSPAAMERARRHREKLRREGLRPRQVWLRDPSSADFIAEAARQSRLVAEATSEDELAFLDDLVDDLAEH